MDWSMVGAIGETLGAVAVFVSLIYLASQIKSNTRQSRATMASSITVEQSRLLDSLGRPDMASILVKLSQDADLDAIEEMSWQTHMARTAHVWAAIEAAHKNGQVDDGFYTDCGRQLASFTSLFPGTGEHLKNILAMNHPSVVEGEVFRALSETGS